MTFASGGKNQCQWREYGAVCKPEHLKINVKNDCIYILNVYGYYSKLIKKYFFNVYFKIIFQIFILKHNKKKITLIPMSACLRVISYGAPKGGGKNWGEWKTFGVGGKKHLSFLILRFFKKLCKTFAVSRKTS